MPYVNIKVTGGEQAPTQAQKAQLIQETTEMLVRILGKNPQTTVVTIEEIPTTNWGIGGQTVAERLHNASS